MASPIRPRPSTPTTVLLMRASSQPINCVRHYHRGTDATPANEFTGASVLQREPPERAAAGVAREIVAYRHSGRSALLKPDPWVHIECFAINGHRGLLQ